MIEKRNFKGEIKKLQRESAEACLSLFKEYSISEMELMVSVWIENEGMSELADAIKLDNPDAKEPFLWFSLRGEYGDWISIGDGYGDFDWADLYDSLCDTINHFLENDIPVSEWNSRETFDDESEEEY